MEERKNNTGLVVLITVLVMLVLGMGTFIVYDKVINKTNEPNSEENNKVDNNEQNALDYVYGYSVYFDENVKKFKIVELHSNSQNKEIMSTSDEVLLESVVQNKLYYTSIDHKIGKRRVMYINLNDSNYSSYEIIDGGEYEHEMGYGSANEDYLFTYAYGEILRYDLKTKEKKVIFNPGSYAASLFIANEKIYFGTPSDSLDNKYFTIDFDGNNYNEITKEKFFNIKKEINHYGTYGQDVYVMHQNKKLWLSQNNVIYNDDIIYTSKNGRSLELYFDLRTDLETIVFHEYTFNGGEFEDSIYYEYNFRTKEMVKISKEKALNIPSTNTIITR